MIKWAGLPSFAALHCPSLTGPSFNRYTWLLHLAAIHLAVIMTNLTKSNYNNKLNSGRSGWGSERSELMQARPFDRYTRLLYLAVILGCYNYNDKFNKK